MAPVSVKGFFAILGVPFLLTSPREVDGLDCLACTGMPYPSDCRQRIKCTSTEKCFIEQVVTQDGVIAYNMGCKATQSCPGTKRGSSASQNVVDFVSRKSVAADVTSDFDAEDEPIVVCSECCNSKNYCNIRGCGAIDVTPQNRQLCGKCDDVLTPYECESLQLCPDNQVCFTEFIDLNGAERYRLGCTKKENCGANSNSTASFAPEVSMIGKRQNNQIPTFLKYCAKCCDNKASGVCNIELCSRDGVVPAGTVVMELQNPPPRNDVCSDLLVNACPALILDQPALCLETRFKHFGCRQSCRTCVDGAWGHWADWSVCNCNSTQTRVRKCDGPAPVGSSQLCQGSTRDTVSCSDKPTTCSVDGQWGSWYPWVACSTICGPGEMSRLRTCNNPRPQNGGLYCHIDQKGEEERMGCQGPPCPTWSPWFNGKCSVTCGNGTETRVRHCSTGHKEDCAGNSSEVVGCQMVPCGVNGSWSSWSPWSQCDVTCENGHIQRTRTCTNPAPAFGGLDCSGEGLETYACKLAKCPSWSEWFLGDCSVTCSDGTLSRIRICSSGHDEDCPGSAFDTVSCSQAPC